MNDVTTYWCNYGQAWANSVDPDQMPHFVASDHGLHCLPVIHRFVETHEQVTVDLVKLNAKHSV